MLSAPPSPARAEAAKQAQALADEDPEDDRRHGRHGGEARVDRRPSTMFSLPPLPADLTVDRLRPRAEDVGKAAAGSAVED
eukprot:15471248-Alexandrium_andersonii.AAC.1